MKFTLFKNHKRAVPTRVKFWTWCFLWPLKKKKLNITFTAPRLVNDNEFHKVFAVQLSKDKEFGISMKPTGFTGTTPTIWGFSSYIKDGNNVFIGWPDENNQVLAFCEPLSSLSAIIEPVTKTHWRIQFYRDGNTVNAPVNYHFNRVGFLWAAKWLTWANPFPEHKLHFNIHLKTLRKHA